jgi:hypothetical protein
MGRVAEGVFAAFDDDDFRWWIVRQADAGDDAGVHRTMGHRDREGVNSWFAARDCRNEVDDYADDLDRAWELADIGAGSADAAGLQCRYVLLRALIGDMGSRFRPELAAILVRSGVWTRDQALAWGRLSLDAQSGLQLIADAIEAAEGTSREELMSLALAARGQHGTRLEGVRGVLYEQRHLRGVGAFLAARPRQRNCCLCRVRLYAVSHVHARWPAVRLLAQRHCERDRPLPGP